MSTLATLTPPAYKFATEEDKGSHIVHSYRIDFVLAGVAQAILKLSPDGVTAPISKVACHVYGLLTRLDYHTIDCYRNWLKDSFTTWELVDYLEGPIQTRSETPMQTPVTGSFQGRIAVASLHRTLLGHYLSEMALPIITVDAGLFQIARPPLSALRLTLTRLQGGEGTPTLAPTMRGTVAP